LYVEAILLQTFFLKIFQLHFIQHHMMMILLVNGSSVHQP